MAKEIAKHCLLYYSAGARTPLTGTVYALDENAGVYTLTRSSGSFVTDGILRGDQIRVQGFNATGQSTDFTAIVTGVVALTLTIKQPVDTSTRQAVAIVDEAAGDTITITPESYLQLLGQDNTTFTFAGQKIDISDKNSDNWGAFLGGSLEFTTEVAGKTEWTNDGTHGGWTEFTEAAILATNINVRLVLNSKLDSYYFPASVTNQTGGGGLQDPNAYGFTLGNAGRPVFVTGLSG